MRNGVLLPCHHGLSEEMFMKLHSVINQFIKRIHLVIYVKI